MKICRLDLNSSKQNNLLTQYASCVINGIDSLKVKLQATQNITPSYYVYTVLLNGKKIAEAYEYHKDYKTIHICLNGKGIEKSSTAFNNISNYQDNKKTDISKTNIYDIVAYFSIPSFYPYVRGFKKENNLLQTRKLLKETRRNIFAKLLVWSEVDRNLIRDINYKKNAKFRKRSLNDILFKAFKKEDLNTFLKREDIFLLYIVEHRIDQLIKYTYTYKEVVEVILLKKEEIFN